MEYPVLRLVLRYVLPLILFMGLIYFISEEIILLDLIVLGILSILLYSIFFQFEYKKIKINREQILIEYPVSFIRNTKIINVNEIELVQFKPINNSWADPFIKIYVGEQRRIKLTFPKHMLISIVNHLEILNIKVEKISY